MAFINFVAGTQLTEANLDTMFRQTVMVFASTAARDSDLSGLLAEGMLTYQSDTNSLTYYTGSAWRTIYTPATSWTPSWTNLSLGNGSVTARYTMAGDRVHAEVGLVYGSTTAITGNVSLTLPVSMNTDVAAGGSGVLLDVSGNVRVPCSVYVNPGGGQSATPVIPASPGLVTSTTPFTWATGDQFEFSFNYVRA